VSRRAKAKVNPSFFPFISVLIAIIGVLTFLVLAVTLTALKPPLVVEAEGDEAAAEGGSAPLELRSVVVVECKDNKAVISNVSEKSPYYGLEFDFNQEWSKVVDIHKENRKHDVASWKGTPFLEFLTQIAHDYKKRYMLFLIRPTGVEPYTVLSDIVNIRNGIKIKSEQLEEAGHWVADWTLVYVEEDRKVNLR
jgi:hypothetical protein